MVEIQVLLGGVPGWTNHGSLGYSTVALVDGRTVLDTGSRTRLNLLEQGLKATDTDPADVRDVLLTHLHWDHCENVSTFPNANVHVPEAELRRVEDGDLDKGTLPSTAALLEDHDVETFNGGEVVPGIEVVSTPGHVEHHVSFTFSDEPGYLFAGDAVKNGYELTMGKASSFYSEEVTATTIRQVRDEYDFVVPGHDTPFFVDDGEVVHTANLGLGVALQLSPDSTTRVETTGVRTDLRDLPSNVEYVAPEQPL